MKKKMNKKSVTVKKAALATVCLACVLSVSACGKKDNRNDNKDPITGESQTQSNDGNGSEAGTDGSNEGGSDTAAGDHSEFEAMIGDENTDPNSIIDYINTNIAGAAVSDVKNFFTGLLGFGDDIRNIDFTRLEDSRKYMPEDMIAFMDLMRLEGDTPSMAMSDEENRKVINMTLSELLERARLFEQHLEKYPNNVSTDAAARMYEEIATSAISGGYNKEEGVEHYYKGESNDVIDQKALQYYQQFVQANPDSNLAKIVTEYINVLQSNDFKINDSMEDFYKGLHGRLNVNNLTNHGTNTGTNGTGNGSMNNGTNNTQNNGVENSSIENSSTENSSTENSSTPDSGADNTAKNNINAVDTVIQGTINR